MRRPLLLFLLAWLIAGPARAASPPIGERYQRVVPVRLERDGERWARRTLARMPLEEKIGQMLMIAARVQQLNLDGPEYQRLLTAVRKYHIGGFGLTVPVQSGLLMKSEPSEALVLTNQLQRESDLPLVFAADFERGLSMRLNGATEFPHAMAFAATGRAEWVAQSARITAAEARAIGVQWNWSPLADVNSNPANPIINTRAFSSDPQEAGRLAAAYIRGSRAGGVLSTAKHFPGHGDTETDSHLGLARVGGDLERLKQVELPPFQLAIAAGVDAVMVAHLSVPALEPDPARVASTSRRVIHDWLQENLKFKGLVVTDALDMGGIMRLHSGTAGSNPSGAAAVAAVKAGVDVLVLPGDLDGAYNGLLNAVRRTEIEMAQIDASVLKILRAKASVGLHRHRFADPDALERTVARPDSLAFAQQVADASVTLVRDRNSLVPFAEAQTNGQTNGTTVTAAAYKTSGARLGLLAVIFTDDIRNDSGRMLERQLLARVPDARVIYVDPANAGRESGPVLDALAGAGRILAAVYAVPQAGRKMPIGGELKNSVSLADVQTSLLERMLAAAHPRMAVITLGNPYLLTEFPAIDTYFCAYSNAAVSEVSAIKALFGEIPLSGHLPVSIPGIAQSGDGLSRPIRMSAGPADSALSGSEPSR